MGAELTMREMNDGDLPGVLELMRISLGEGQIPRDAQYWRWKHRDNPFGKSPCLIAEAGGRIVGFRAFMRWSWTLGSETIRAVRAVDTATHPDWRGKGIFSRLTLALVRQLADRGVAFVFNTPNRYSMPGYLKMGWRQVGRTQVRIRPLRLLDSCRRDGRCRPIPRGTDVVESSVDDLLAQTRSDELLERLSRSPERLTTPRTISYLRWRYGDIPGFEYRAAYRLAGAAGAAVIYRERSQSRLRELRICEVLVAREPASVDCARRLLRHLFMGSGAHYAAAMAAEGTAEASVLSGASFLPPVPLGPVMTARPLSEPAAPEGLLHWKRWRTTIGDLEIF